MDCNGHFTFLDECWSKPTKPVNHIDFSEDGEKIKKLILSADTTNIELAEMLMLSKGLTTQGSYFFLSEVENLELDQDKVIQYSEMESYGAIASLPTRIITTQIEIVKEREEGEDILAFRERTQFLKYKYQAITKECYLFASHKPEGLGRFINGNSFYDATDAIFTIILNFEKREC